MDTQSGKQFITLLLLAYKIGVFQFGAFLLNQGNKVISLLVQIIHMQPTQKHGVIGVYSFAVLKIRQN